MAQGNSSSTTASFPFAIPSNNDDDDGIGGHGEAIARGGTHLLQPTTSSSDATAALRLRELKEELSNLPHDKKSCLVHAQRIAPELVDDAHLMRFLMAEDFDVRFALRRLLRYWEHRYKVFGSDKFALPITLNGAMKDSIPAIRNGFLTILPELDEAGRAIIFVFASRGEEIPSDEKIKVWWYLLHAAMDIPGVIENGFVVLSNASGSRVNHFDGKYTLAVCYSGDQYFPIRWKMTHVCNAMPVVWPLVASSVKAVLSKEQRKSFVLHNGTDEMILDSLAQYWLPKTCIPSSMGGSLHLSMEVFIQKRFAIEGGTDNTNNGGIVRAALDTISSSVSSTSSQGQNNTGDNETVFKVSSTESPERNNTGVNETVSKENGSHEGGIKRTPVTISSPVSSSNFQTQNNAGDNEILLKDDQTRPPERNNTGVNEIVSKENGSTIMAANSLNESNSDEIAKLSLPSILPMPPAVIPSISSLPASLPGLPPMHAQAAFVTPQIPTAAPQKKLMYNHNDGTGPKPKPKKKSQPTKAKIPAANSKSPPGRGCAGDPRMNKAVAAKLENQFLPLVSALEAGGFEFPGMYEPGVNLSTVKDTDGVSMYQRRNQLLRRLRLAKGKKK